MSRFGLVACVALFAVVLTAAAALRLWIPERCAPPSEADKKRLISFVRLKYNLPSNAEIGVADGGPVFNSCFREMVFATLSGRAFRAELFASPDFRFLIGDLLDTRPDPRAAAERKRQTAEALTSGDAAERGGKKALATLAIFSDFQCPYCAQLAKNVNDLAASQGEKLRIVYHYYPLSIHHWARSAAEAAACAHRQGNVAFWSLHDFLFAHQKELSPDNLAPRIAAWARTEPSLDPKEFDMCVARSSTSGQVEQDIALGNELGVAATPTVFLNGEPISDHAPDKLRSLVEAALDARH
jgi:protein-disulfide isomerase